MPKNLYLSRGGSIDPGSALAQDIRDVSDPIIQAQQVRQMQRSTSEQQTALQDLASMFSSMPGFQPIAEGIEETYAPAMEQQVSQNLQAAFSESPEDQMRSITDQMAGRVLAKVAKEQGKTTDGKLDTSKIEAGVAEKIQQLLKHSKAIGKSGTGNTLVQQIYERVAEILKEQLSVLQDQGIKDILESK